MNNSSLLTADRSTHVKIVVVSLVFAILVAGVGVASRITDAGLGTDGRFQANAPVVKVSKPITASAGATTVIR